MATTRCKTEKTSKPMRGETETNSNISNETSFDDIDLNSLGEEGKIIAMLMNKRFDTLEGKLEAKTVRISELETEISKLKIAMADLTDQLDDVISDGYAGEILLSGDGVPQSTNDENISLVVKTTLESKLKYKLDHSNVLFAHRVGKKSPQGPDNRPIRLKLSNPDLSRDIIKSCKVSRPSNLFINEWLTPAKSRLLTVLRHAKKRMPDKVTGCGSHNGRVFVWIKSPNLNAGKNQKIFIDGERKLEEFCNESLNCPVNEIFNRRD